MQDIPSPEVVLSDLERLTPIIYEAIEAATTYAGDYFFERGLDLDLYLAPALVRYTTKLRLKAVGQIAEDEETFDLGTMPNNGLILRYGRYRIRILKANNDGDLPVPGPSQSRQAFYQQYTLALPGQEKEDTLNLIVLWDVDSAYRLRQSAGLQLACPRAGDTTRSSVAKHWIVPIPYPIAIEVVQRPIVEEPFIEMDLPITFLEDEEDSSKNAWKKKDD